MAQLDSSQVVKPFGEVNVFNEPGGTIRVRATILMKPQVEGAQTGLAIDGSNSMNALFGGNLPAFFGTPNNLVQPVARTMAEYLANFDSDGNTTVIYWACGVGGAEVEELGDMNADRARTFPFKLPKRPGTGTKLKPALHYFAENKFPAAPWFIGVLITDGRVEDLEDVKAYTLQLAREMAARQRGFFKLVLIGLGDHVDEEQMAELDDLDYGGLKDPDGDEIDIWDHTLAASMQSLDEVFKEVVSAQTILAPSATITDSAGQAVRPVGRASYADGLPALLEFTMSRGATAFTLTLPDGKQVVQPVTF